MHPQSPLLTIGGTERKESDDQDIVGVIFDSEITFEKHLGSVSRAASQRFECDIALRQSVPVLCMLYRSGVIRCTFFVVLYMGRM